MILLEAPAMDNLTKYLPLNDDSHFNPDQFLLIRSPSLASTIEGFELPTQPENNANPGPTPASPACMTISRKSLLHRSYQLYVDQESDMVATISNSLRSLGHWTLDFPADSPHSSHPLTIRPVKVNSRVDFFVKDSVPYLWGFFDGGNTKALFKGLGDGVVKVAEFNAHSTQRVDGTFAIDTAQIDRVVAVAACVACLKRVESWRM